ncbi:hypothetical protein FB561_0125 [Kribbella amoyensis]|uniref:Uncharacterized protein n=1 Tax=Kribbella amoyensis TaxID=996641 RepID=A0A561BJM5_9ACTN|nr:hypothetical protein [Kribbella amoyensis]TWD79074.1 hypothetical protein FB561_0125 [Kribbella amoyensis]
MTPPADMPLPTDRRVRAWLGEHLIADYIGEADAAGCMRSRFLSLRVTNEPAIPAGIPDARTQ